MYSFIKKLFKVKLKTVCLFKKKKIRILNEQKRSLRDTQPSPYAREKFYYLMIIKTVYPILLKVIHS